MVMLRANVFVPGFGWAGPAYGECPDEFAEEIDPGLWGAPDEATAAVSRVSTGGGGYLAPPVVADAVDPPAPVDVAEVGGVVHELGGDAVEPVDPEGKPVKRSRRSGTRRVEKPEG